MDHTPTPPATPVTPSEPMPVPPMGRRGRAKTDIDRRALLAGAGLIGAAALVRSAKAGDLTPPPGPIAATGRTLKDVEPRTNANALPGNNEYMCIIQQKGSYYLTADILVTQGKGGILVAVPSGTVTIDFEGFTIRGVSGGTHNGVSVESAGLSCLEVSDGFIRDLGGDGIDSGGCRVLDVYDMHIDNCNQGVVVRCTGMVDACHVERCLSHGCAWLKSPGSSCCFVCDDSEFRSCGGHGICMTCDGSQGDATFCVCDCDCLSNGLDGVHLDWIGGSAGTGGASCTGSLSDCRCLSNGGHGGRLSNIGTRCVVQIADCCCNSNTLGGLRCASMCVDVMDVACCDNGGHGVSLDRCSSSSCECCVSCRNAACGVFLTGCTRVSVDACSSHSNVTHGLCADGTCSAMCVTDCDSSGNANGFTIQTSSCCCLWNTASGNTQNFSVAPGAPVVVIQGSDLAASTCPHGNYSLS